MRKSVALFLCLFGFALIGMAQSPSPAPPLAKPSSWGTVENGVFSSPIIGLRITIPAAYTLISTAEADLLASAGADMLKQGGANSQIDDALNRTIKLVAFSELPLMTPGNSSLEIVAAKQQSGVTAKMSLIANVTMLKNSPLVLKGSRTFRVGKNTFETADLEGVISGVTLKERMYVIMHKGYSIVIVIAYIKEEQLPNMEKVLATLTLSK